MFPRTYFHLSPVVAFLLMLSRKQRLRQHAEDKILLCSPKWDLEFYKPQASFLP